MEQFELSVDAIGDDDPFAMPQCVGQGLPRADFGAHVDIEHHGAGCCVFRQAGERTANPLAEGFLVNLLTAIGVRLLANLCLLIA